MTPTGGVSERYAHTSSVLLCLALALGSGVALGGDPPLTLEDIDLTETSGVASVVLKLSSTAEGSAVSTFTLSDPAQVVVDIANADAMPDVAALVDKGALITNVTVESFQDNGATVTRVRFFLSETVVPMVTTVGSEVRVSLDTGKRTADPLASALGGDATPERAPDEPTATSASAAAGPALLSGPQAIAASSALSSLDFQALADVSRVVIGTSTSLDYVATQPRSNLIVIDFPGAFVPQSLTRTLDASQFLSPVRVVRAYRTSTGARVAIDLRQDASYTVAKAASGLIYVDIPVPAELQREREQAEQAASGVSPSSGEQGIKNAYQSEILIGSSGRTVDPQAAFGSGGGSNDPSALLGAASGFSMDTSSASDTPYTGRRINLDFVNADIHSIFRLISSVSRLNIIASDDVKGTVTVRMEDVPWDLAFAAVLQAKGLGSQRFGNGMSSETILLDARIDGVDENLVVRVAPIETIKSEQQSALEAKRAKEELTELQLLVIPLNYAQASEISAQVSKLLGKRGSIQIDSRGNQLILQDTEDRLAQIRELVRHLDKQTPQVLIEARIVEATASFDRSLGIQWGGELDASTSTGYSTGLFFPNSVGVSGGVSQDSDDIFYSRGQDNLIVDAGASASTGSMAISLGSIPGLVSLDARLSAMESDGKGKVVSSPRITTVDNQTATIKQGAKVPYLSSSAGGTQVQFVQAALTLEVTPHITSDGKVFLNVKIANNRPDFANLVQGQPAISIKEAETQVLVADGDTTVIGGVYATEDSWSQSRVPFFSKIPVLGYLFKNSTSGTSRDEMLVFITPRIVTRSVAADGS